MFLHGGVRAPISSLRAEPVVQLASETRLRAQRPTAILWGWQHVIKCSVGNGLDRSECLAHMPFGKNILLGLGTDIFGVCGKEPPLRPLRVQRKQRPVPSVALRHLPASRGVTPQRGATSDLK